MNLCGDGHEEIVYDGRRCPLCTAVARIAELEKEVENLEYELLEARESLN